MGSNGAARHAFDHAYRTIPLGDPALSGILVGPLISAARRRFPSGVAEHLRDGFYV
ncbi:hypothetical protein [Nocardia sp. NPDC057227]|uniref:hypothetical protein n=1 Tax=Nocardia sp. NPDC057227 TaxID=3346056 RepID=UPI0036333182